MSYIIEVIKKYGVRGLCLVLFFIAIVLFLCTKGINPFGLEKYGIECGCNQQRKELQEKIDTVRVIISTKDSLHKQLEDARQKLQRIRNELARSDSANNILADSMGVLEARIIDLENKISKQESELSLKQAAIDSLNALLSTVNGDPDSAILIAYQDTIRELRFLYDTSETRNRILENVFIEDIEVKKINNQRVLVNYTLRGADTLIKYLAKLNIEPRLKLKVRDLKTDSLLENIESNPKFPGSKRDYEEASLKLEDVKNNKISGTSYFTNTEKSPFKGTKFLGLVSPEYDFQFYLDGFNRPLCTIPKKTKK